jgi:hypothetical protein
MSKSSRKSLVIAAALVISGRLTVYIPDISAIKLSALQQSQQQSEDRNLVVNHTDTITRDDRSDETKAIPHNEQQSQLASSPHQEPSQDHVNTKMVMTGTDEPIFADPILSTISSSNSTIPIPSIERPTSNNTLIALVSMGTSTNSFIVHRCVRSVRTRGDFTGYIMVLTDEEGFPRLSETLPAHDDKLLLVQGHDEDFQPTTLQVTSNETATEQVPIVYRTKTMIYKRFKTLLLKYAAENPVTNAVIDYVLYLDVDNVAANPLQKMFDDYFEQFETVYQRARESTNTTAVSESFFSFWRDPGLPHLWQGGQTMHHRRYSQVCSDAWRKQMDTNPDELMDQPLLVRAMDAQREEAATGTAPLCHILKLPHRGTHFALLTKRIIRSYGDKLPTIVHITGLRTNKYSVEKQQAFLYHALNLQPLLLSATESTVPIVAAIEDNSTFFVAANNTHIALNELVYPVKADGRRKES